jgi:hypothetical protein
MNIVILDDYQDAVRKLKCASRLDAFPAKVYTNTVKGIGQLSVRLKDADVIVLIRERTAITRQLVEKLPRLKLIVQTGRVGAHIDVAACTERGIAVAEGTGSPVAPCGIDLGPDHGGHAPPAPVHRQSQARRLAAIRTEVGCDAAEFFAWPGSPRQGALASGVMEKLGSSLPATARLSACTS